MASKIPSNQPPKSLKYLLLATVVVLVLAITGILLIEYGTDVTENITSAGHESTQTNEGHMFCDETKGATEHCDSIKDCYDGRDEKNCHMRTGMTCNDFRCSSQTKEYQCLPMKVVCDGKKDCLDGSDEINCDDKCGKIKYLCPRKDSNDSLCINHEYVCDGVADCPDKTDEEGCATWIWWGPWCKVLIAPSNSCYLIRQRYCQHARGRIIKMVQECRSTGLYYPEVEVEDILRACQDPKDVDLETTSFCPGSNNASGMSLKKSVTSTNTTTHEPLKAEMSRRNMMSMHTMISGMKMANSRKAKETGLERITSLSEDKPRMATEETKQEVPRHVKSIIVGCCAFALCVLFVVTAYFVGFRNQYRTYNVAKYETPVQSPARRVSTSDGI